MKLRTAGATLCALAAMGANASAATLKVDGNDAETTFTYTGSPNEASNLVVTTAGNSITFTESTGLIVVMPDATRSGALERCPVPLGFTVTCTFTSAPQNTKALINLGDGDDEISFEGTSAVVKVVNGGDGADVLGGGNGVGGELIGGKGADVFVANAGSTVSYRGASAPLFISVDGVADDGLSGEGDNVQTGFTSYLLGASDDEFFGGVLGESIAGGGGLDTIYGGLGGDVITANGRLTGGPGNDRLLAGNRMDVLNGGPGNDYLSGGLAADTLDGGDGTDELHPSLGADVVAGGAGADYVNVPKDGAFDRIDCGSDSDKADWTTGFESSDSYVDCEEIS